MAQTNYFQPTTPDPFAAMGGGFWTGSGWVTKDHPLAAGASGTSSTTGSSNKLTVQAAPGFTAPTWQAPTAAKPQFTAAPVYQGPAPLENFAAPDPNSIYQDPSYNWRLQQGVKARDLSAASRGAVRSGAHEMALTDYGQQAGAQEYGDIFNRALQTYGVNQSTWDRNVRGAEQAFDRGRLERDARYAAETGDWNRDADERTRAFDARFRTAAAEYAPTLTTWEAESLANQANFDRDWSREQYQGDDAYRRWRDEMDNAYRNRVYAGDDSYRRDVMDEDRRRFLVTQGNY